MKSVKEARDRAWQHEFEQIDDEVGSMRTGRERAHRAALGRLRGVSVPMMAARVSDLPDQLAAMSRLPMTKHAAHRLKNRGITMQQVLVVTDYGRPQRAHGATRYALDRVSRELLQRTMPPDQLRSLKSLDIIAVVADDGALITVAHRTGRVRRDISKH